MKGPQPDPVVLRSADGWIAAADPVEVVTASGAGAFERLARLTPGWWAGFLTYDLGRAVERVHPRLSDDLRLPDLVLARYDARALVGRDGRRIEARTRSARRRLAERLDASVPARPRPALPAPGTPRSSLSRDEFEAAVRSVVALIEAGECYQVNLTRRLVWDAPARPWPLFDAIARRQRARYAALLDLPLPDGDRVALVSASPERFLRWRGRDVETRPVKGTGRDAARLVRSAKDRAENVMIVDLARNDLGRVSEPGTVRVPELCAPEHHPGLVHLVSSVRARLRAGVGPAELLRATFPAASITGAPKPRVLQAIEDLEPVRRGVYCGAVGWLDTERGEGDLSVAIRTFTIARGATFLGVGGGIVADSDPASEWQETELKAARLVAIAAGAGAGARARARRPAGVA
ncbi:MAG TPA: anthranilate synthase component I family protein [Acidimicrobiia bacterium]|nr:anthranilate synthase component I family protein [Acidimicrobiia bacterium]